jgi:CRISPR-associated protein Csd1
MVREVMQGSFEELATNTAEWFKHLTIVALDGHGLARDPKFLAVAGSLVRELKDLSSPCLQQLWRAGLKGGPIPSGTLALALNRVRLDAIKGDRDGDQRERALRNYQAQTRMALIKVYLIRNKGDQHMQPYLSPDHPHPAYHCGRALALFARLQRAALGDVGAGVVQRYYTAAAQTPGLILGRLASNAKNHLNKLDSGLAAWYEGQLAEIMGCVKDGIPRTLRLEEQSLFALGYYQQIAHMRAGKRGLPDGMADDTSDAHQPE